MKGFLTEKWRRGMDKNARYAAVNTKVMALEGRLLNRRAVYLMLSVTLNTTPIMGRYSGMRIQVSFTGKSLNT